MGKFTKLATIGAAIGGFLFFWRKRQANPAPGGPATPPKAADKPPSST